MNLKGLPDVTEVEEFCNTSKRTFHILDVDNEVNQYANENYHSIGSGPAPASFNLCCSIPYEFEFTDCFYIALHLL